MCGIFAYVGDKQNAGELILDGLKSLEYRGYDSWGVAVKKTDGSIFLQKKTGKIGDAQLPPIISSIGLGHTRWATHGGVTEANAHPHIDCSGKIIIVHNGIVENFADLKKDLQEKGHNFKSETDTEVIAHLLEEHHKSEKDLKKLVLAVFNLLKGMNAVIAFFPDEDIFYAIKNGSPIVLGKSPHEFIIASDAAAIVQYTRDVYFLDDYELVSMTKQECLLFDLEGMPKNMALSQLQYDKSQVSLGDFKHYLIKEISEQPIVIRNILETQKGNISQVAETIKNAYGTYLIGCGTASYACLAGTYLFSKIAKRHVNACIGSEFTYSLDFLKDNSLVMALSQSGETIDIISSVKKAKDKGAKILAMTNVIGSTLYRMSDYKLLLNAGPEKSVCSTKAYIAKITMLYLIAHTLAGNYSEGADHLNLAVAEVENLLQHKERLEKLASELVDTNHIFILGRGVSYPTALESTLKIKEVAYIHAEGFAAGELKHGVIALIEKGTPVIVYNPEDETYEDTLSSAHEVKARGARVIGISSKPNAVYDEYIEVKNCNDATIIPNVVIAQLLGYYLSVAKGYDPDKPRNLAKSVVVK